ncbi:MAG: pirin family protein [Bryobacterales bacterium]|nr:pirin family protein [Bryobacterales bacterium]
MPTREQPSSVQAEPAIHPHRDAEIVAYVSAGSLTHRDNMGHEAAITAGEMQLISTGSRGIVHSEKNVHDVIEHNYQLWLIPDRPGTGGWVQVVDGELRVAGLVLHPGDGAGIADVSQLDFTFDADSEVLLFEVHMDAPLLWR